MVLWLRISSDKGSYRDVIIKGKMTEKEHIKQLKRDRDRLDEGWRKANERILELNGENARLREAVRMFFLEWDDQHDEDIAVAPEVISAVSKLRFAFGFGQERRETAPMSGKVPVVQ